MFERTCVVCGKKFQTDMSNKKTCSPECSSQNAKNLIKEYYKKIGKARRNSRIEKNCVICGKKFFPTASYPHQKTCSIECAVRYHRLWNRENQQKYKEAFLAENKPPTEPPKLQIKICPQCGIEFQQRAENQIYCSKQCRMDFYKAERDATRINNVSNEPKITENVIENVDIINIVEPSVELMTDFDGEKVMKFIEKCGRVCYKSENNITPDSATQFVKNLISRGHESVLEHFSVTFKIICDRGIMAELTRHRLASFSIESTRYNNYASEKFNNEIKVICPFPPILEYRDFIAWKKAVGVAAQIYTEMANDYVRPEIARSVLPTCLATEIVMTANLREWRHVLKLRRDRQAHPQMQEIAIKILKVLKEKLPVIFEDIGA